MITQLANSKLERIQLLMGTILFCIFITYSLNYVFENSSAYITTAIIIQSIFIVLLMRIMLQNKTTVKPYFAWKTNKYKALKFNYITKSIGFILLGGLTILHFYIDYKYKGEIMPLIYDYGIGGIAALGLKFIVLERNWNLGLSDKGVIFGSKFDTKLIEWTSIDSYKENPSDKSVILYCKSDSPIKSIKLETGKQFENTLLILEQAISK